MLAITIILLHYLDILFTILSRRGGNSWNSGSLSSAQSYSWQSRSKEVSKGIVPACLSQVWRTRHPSNLPLLLAKMSNTFGLFSCFISIYTHWTDRLGYPLGLQDQGAGLFQAFRWGGLVQELRHFVLRSTWPLTTVYISASLPILAFSRASRKANESPECFTTGTIP